MQVVVGLEERRVRGGDDGLEEGTRPQLRRLADEVVIENAVEDTIL